MPLAEAGHAFPSVPEREVSDAAALDEALREARTPFVIRGLVADWPLVEAGRQSGKAARDYLLSHHRNRPFIVSTAPAEAKGRIFYDDDMRVNFTTAQVALGEAFAQIADEEGADDAPTRYFGSIDIHDYFDEALHEANHVDLGGRDSLDRIWMGTATRIAPHSDFTDNLACCAVGPRTFTLFPPDQFANLYFGPLDNTPAGPPISMVDVNDPDFEAFPRARDAFAAAQVAELQPGDALFVPSMWIHHVEAFAPFNVLVNYWWSETPSWYGKPRDAMIHAIMAIRELPPEQRDLWRQMFDHYVFSGGEDAAAHLPDHARGILAPHDKTSVQRMRAYLMRALTQ